MLKKFVWWFICFGLSYLVSDVFHWTDQGNAFLWIFLGSSVLLIIGLIVVLLIGGIATRSATLMTSISFLVIIVMAVVTAITLFATWGATKLFNVEFYVAFQIMTFGQCLCPDVKKKNDDD